MNENGMIDALNHHLGSHRWWLCPNVVHGRNEIDLLAVSRTGWAYEWEIKCSLADWRNDLKKGRHDAGARGAGIAFFNYAVAESIVPEDLSWVPDYAGIYTVGDHGLHVRKIRAPKKLGTAVLWDKADLWRLCYYRYWGMREKYRKAVRQLKHCNGYGRNDLLHRALLEDLKERQRVPVGVMLPSDWRGVVTALEKTKTNVKSRA
jgi:hypothetical protein